MCSGIEGPSGLSRRLGRDFWIVLTSRDPALVGRTAEHNVDVVLQVCIVACKFVYQITNEQGMWHILQAIELSPLANR